jgi:hypothetical protein
VAGSGPQILDFSGGFAFEEGAGLLLEVTDSLGNLLGAGERFRVVAAQGAELFVRVFGAADPGSDPGAGAYTLVINVLPQVVGVEAQALLPGVGDQPGGPTTSIVLTLQGDRLDPATAENKNNYRVTWLGADGVPGQGDDQVIPLSSGVQSVVYSPSTNVDILTGTRFPTAIQQTITLLFDQPLPAGSYRIEVLPAVQTEDFNASEDGLLSGGAPNGHPLAQATDASLAGGAIITADNLVLPAGPLGSFSAFDAGTPFLSQLHDDLAAILDSALTEQGDDPGISQRINDHIRERMAAALGQLATPPSLLVVWLDPGSFVITEPAGGGASYDIGNDDLMDEIDGAYVDVIGNIEVIVLAPQEGVYDFVVSDLGEQARGGYVLVSEFEVVTESFTPELRSGITEFEIVTMQFP